MFESVVTVVCSLVAIVLLTDVLVLAIVRLLRC